MQKECFEIQFSMIHLMWLLNRKRQIQGLLEDPKEPGLMIFLDLFEIKI